MIGRIIGYGTIAAASFGAGYYRAYCKDKGINLPTLAELGLTYGMPLAGAGCAAAGEVIDAAKCREDTFGFGVVLGLFGGAVGGGLVSLLFEGAGYITGGIIK